MKTFFQWKKFLNENSFSMRVDFSMQVVSRCKQNFNISSLFNASSFSNENNFSIQAIFSMKIKFQCKQLFS
jgi:hypothetical protein